MAAKFGASLAAGAGACASLASSDEDEHPKVNVTANTVTSEINL
jgi:hypothetical protein